MVKSQLCGHPRPGTGRPACGSCPSGVHSLGGQARHRQLKNRAGDRERGNRWRIIQARGETQTEPRATAVSHSGRHRGGLQELPNCGEKLRHHPWCWRGAGKQSRNERIETVASFNPRFTLYCRVTLSLTVGRTSLSSLSFVLCRTNYFSRGSSRPGMEPGSPALQADS